MGRPAVRGRLRALIRDRGRCGGGRRGESVTKKALSCWWAFADPPEFEETSIKQPSMIGVWQAGGGGCSSGEVA